MYYSWSKCRKCIRVQPPTGNFCCSALFLCRHPYYAAFSSMRLSTTTGPGLVAGRVLTVPGGTDSLRSIGWTNWTLQVNMIRSNYVFTDTANGSQYYVFQDKLGKKEKNKNPVGGHGAKIPIQAWRLAIRMPGFSHRIPAWFSKCLKVSSKICRRPSRYFVER